MDELESVQAHGHHLLQKQECFSAWCKRQEAESAIQIKKHADYATEVKVKLAKLASGVKQQYQVDLNYHTIPRFMGAIQTQPSVKGE